MLFRHRILFFPKAHYYPEFQIYKKDASGANVVKESTVCEGKGEGSFLLDPSTAPPVAPMAPWRNSGGIL